MWTALVPLAVIGAVAAFAIARSAPAGPTGATVIAVADRVAAPTDTLPLLDGGEGGIGAGQVTVVNFWASWCGPCRTEQPELNQAHDELSGEDVAFLGVALQDTEPNAAAHWREFDVPYPTGLDPTSRFASRFEGVGPQAIPTTIVVDREGRVAARVFGATSAAQLTGLVSELLAE